MVRITYIAIGDELLRGRVVNTNARMLALQLRPAGFSVSRIVTIEDDPGAIQHCVETELKTADVLLLSGGLGPTKDDLTKHTLAGIFGMALVWHQPTLDYLEARYASQGRQLNEFTRSQALVPDGCTVLPNPRGTAPGMLFQVGNKQVYSLPGVPFELRYQISQEVIPRLSHAFAERSFFLRKVYRLAGIPESEAAQRLDALHADFPPFVKLSYLPRQDGLWLELQASGPLSEQGAAVEVLERLGKGVHSAVADRLYAEDDRDLAVLVGEQVLKKGGGLATAESLTAGLLAARIVEVSGASRYFKGGIVAYETVQKTRLLDVPAATIEKYGVVSREVAEAMALGAQKALGADLALATTGLAEQDQETGTPPHAWVAVALPDRVIARHIRLYGDRNEARTRCADAALVLALQNLP